MSFITIEAHLVAHDETLRHLWELMTDKNTPLINKSIEQVEQHPDFEKWLKKGTVSQEAIRAINKPLKTQEIFADQPGCFSASADTLVQQTYKSWFALQQRRQRQLEGKERWLKIFKSDQELQQESQCDLNIIRAKASEILSLTTAKLIEDRNQLSKQKDDQDKKDYSKPTLINLLFTTYETTDDGLSQCAIAYLLKNNCHVSDIDEDPEKYIKRREQKEIAIERLREQLNSQKPKGRDLTGEKWLAALDNASNQMPQDEHEAKNWQKILLQTSNCMPYPVEYTTNTKLEFGCHKLNNDINIQKMTLCQIYSLKLALNSCLYSFIKYIFSDVKYKPNKNADLVELLKYSNNKSIIWQIWLIKLSLKSGLKTFRRYVYSKLLKFSSKKPRYFVKFNGLVRNLNHPEFYIFRDQRHLHYFKRFYQDYNTWKNQKDLSSGLFLLRSARLLWRERKGKGQPWQVHQLVLQCCIDLRLWTKEGTEIVRIEKIKQADKSISNKETKGELSQGETSSKKRKLTERENLNNSFPNRPSKAIYQGKSDIIVGVSLGLNKPVTVAVINAVNQKVMAYRSTKQLLGNQYHLLQRQRKQQQYLSHKRHKAQKQNAPNSFGESELGQYIDRLLANSIIAIAKTYSAGSIVLPKLYDMREIIESEVKARAKKKIPGYEKGQDEYAKQYRINIHRWSYGRLIKTIQNQASKAGISIEISFQPIGKDNLMQSAKNLALSAYQERQVNLH